MIFFNLGNQNADTWHNSQQGMQLLFLCLTDRPTDFLSSSIFVICSPCSVLVLDDATGCRHVGVLVKQFSTLKSMISGVKVAQSPVGSNPSIIVSVPFVCSLLIKS